MFPKGSCQVPQSQSGSFPKGSLPDSNRHNGLTYSSQDAVSLALFKGKRPFRPERLSSCRAIVTPEHTFPTLMHEHFRAQALRVRVSVNLRSEWIPMCGCDPAYGSRAPDHQSLVHGRVNGTWIRDWIDRLCLRRLSTSQEYDRRCVRPTTATDTVNNSHPRFVRLPHASRVSPV